MFIRAFLLLQIVSGQDSTTLKKLNFDPHEQLNISRDTLNLENLDFRTCLETRTVYPIIATIPLIRNIGSHPRTVKIQECFIRGSELREKIVIVTYYNDDKKTKTPVAFVSAFARSDSTREDGSLMYTARWGLVDEGFFETGKATRHWLRLLPQSNAPRDSWIENKLKELLLQGFNRAKKNKN